MDRLVFQDVFDVVKPVSGHCRCSKLPFDVFSLLMTVGDNNYDFTSAILESSSWFCISFPQRERCRRQQRSKSFWTAWPPSLTTRQPKKEMLLYTTVSSARGILDPTGRHPPQLGLGPPRWFQHQNTHRNRVQGAAQPLGRRRGQVVLAFNRAGCCDRGRWC